tara:strand:- start:219 stop:572 length:354 start_codon:yes stop_codon:yes gene_type:complete
MYEQSEEDSILKMEYDLLQKKYQKESQTRQKLEKVLREYESTMKTLIGEVQKAKNAAVWEQKVQQLEQEGEERERETEALRKQLEAEREKSDKAKEGQEKMKREAHSKAEEARKKVR